MAVSRAKGSRRESVVAWLSVASACVSLLQACGSDAPTPIPDTGTLGDDAEMSSDSGTGGVDAGQSDAGVIANPCGDVPPEGRCRDMATIEYCSQDLDSEIPAPDAVRTFACAADERCMIVDDNADCVLTTECRAGDTRCRNATTLQTCMDGAWADSPCAPEDECADSGVGPAECATIHATASEPGADTVTLTGRVVYQRRLPNADLTNWDTALVDANLEDVLVIAYRGMELLDNANTIVGGPNAGTFTLRVPSTLDANDRIVVIARHHGGGDSVDWAVASPQFGAAGTHGTDETARIGASARIWSWTWTGDALPSDQVFRITDEMGSGAAHIYERMGAAFRYGQQRYMGVPTLSVIAWLEFGVQWSCGNCFNTSRSDLGFDSQLWVGGVNSYWSDSTDGHEMGHWLMSTYGRSPREGGAHTVYRGAYPGLAWSEGWATFFSSELRNDPTYFTVYDSGATIWWNLSSRMYTTAAWARPRPDGTNAEGTAMTTPEGLFQLVSENEVAATLWQLAQIDPGAVYDALRTPRMRTPVGGAFERGYFSQTVARNADFSYRWISTSSYPAAVFPDFLDALNCEGVIPRARIAEIVDPANFYPYPVDMPVCR